MAVVRSCRVQCPNPDCLSILSISLEMQGQRLRCGVCGRSFRASPPRMRVFRQHRRDGGPRTRRRAG